MALLVCEVQIEATSSDRTKLLTIHNPILNMDGDLELALEGSFLPMPNVSVFHPSRDDDNDDVAFPSFFLRMLF